MPHASKLDELSILDVTNGKQVGPAINIAEMIDSCLCSDQSSVAVISHHKAAGLLSFYDVQSGQPSLPSIDLESPPISISARSTHPQVAVLCENGELLIFDTRDGNRLRQTTHPNWWWDSPYYTTFARTSYTPDGDTLIVVTTRGEIFVRNAETGEQRFPPIELKLHLKQAHCPAIDFSSDSRLLVTAITGKNAVQVWDLKTGSAVSRPIPHPGDFWGLFAVKFSPDQRLVFTANKDGQARLWDWRTETMVCPPLEHPAEVYDVAFTPDGNYGITIDRADTVRLWELKTGKLIAAPIHYPTRPDGFALSLFNVEMVGHRAFLGAPDFPVLDLSQLLVESQLSTESLLTTAELASTRRITLGESSGLTLEEWQRKWDEFTTHPTSE